MNLSFEENLVIERFLYKVRFNPLVELVYLTEDSNKINVITVCNFKDSRNLLNGTDKKEIIKLIKDSISDFNIDYKDRRFKFYSDDIANYYRPLDEKKRFDDDNDYLNHDRISLGDAFVLLDKEEAYVKNKKKKKVKYIER